MLLDYRYYVSTHTLVIACAALIREMGYTTPAVKPFYVPSGLLTCGITTTIRSLGSPQLYARGCWGWAGIQCSAHTHALASPCPCPCPCGHAHARRRWSTSRGTEKLRRQQHLSARHLRPHMFDVSCPQRKRLYSTPYACGLRATSPSIHRSKPATEPDQLLPKFILSAPIRSEKLFK